MARNPVPVLDKPWRRPGALRYALSRLRRAVRPPVTVTAAPADIVAESDVAVPTRDGTTLRINVYRKAGAAPQPVVLSIHPYGKDKLPKLAGQEVDVLARNTARCASRSR